MCPYIYAFIYAFFSGDGEPHSSRAPAGSLANRRGHEIIQDCGQRWSVDLITSRPRPSKIVSRYLGIAMPYKFNPVRYASVIATRLS